MKMNKKILLAFLILGTSAFASCDCSNAVSNNYERIKQQVPNHFEGIKEKLEDTIDELDKTIEQKEEEIKLLDKAIENKSSIVSLHQKEISQLEKLNEYVKNQNDAKTISTRTEVSKTQNSILDNMTNQEKNSEETFWKK